MESSTSSVNEVAFLLLRGGARIAIAGDQEHLDKLFHAERQRGEPLDTIVLIDARTGFLDDDPRLMLFADFEVAMTRLREQAANFIAEVTPDTVVGLIFILRHHRRSQGAYYTHAGMMVGLGYGLLEVMPDLRERPHRVVTHLPLAHGMGQGLSMFVLLFAELGGDRASA